MTELYFKIMAAVAPAIILFGIILKKDKKPEPVGWLLAAIGLGVLIGPAIFLLAYLGLPNINHDNFISAVLSSFISAAIPEEGLKFAALYLLAISCKHFDEYFDGIVYAVCIGMGFAGLENILYVCGDDEWLIISISRALMSVPMHYFFAVIMGAFFSLGWFDRKNRKKYLVAALIIPIIVHGVYDTFCLSIGLNEDLSFLILIAFMLGFKYVRRYTKKLIDHTLKLDSYGYPTR